MTGKSLCCCTYWTNTETPIVFGRNVTGLSQAWEPCCLCSDPIPCLNVFTCKRQIINNGILTDSRGRACPHADAAGATHSNSYLHVSVLLHQKAEQKLRPQTCFSSRWPMRDMNKTKVFWIHLIDIVTMNCIWTFSLFLCSKTTPYSCNEVKSLSCSEKSVSRVKSHRRKLGAGWFFFSAFKMLDLDLVAKQTKTETKLPIQSVSRI